MPQKDNKAAELKHAKEIGFVIFPAADQSAKVVKPGEEALDFPAAAVAAQFTAGLSALPAAIELGRCARPDGRLLPKALAQGMVGVCRVTDHSFRLGSCEGLLVSVLSGSGVLRRS